LEMVNHPEEDSIRTTPPHHQDVHICYGPGQGPFLPCSVVATGFGFELTFNTPNIPTSIRIGLYNVKVKPCTLVQMSEIWTWTRSIQGENHLLC
jgi:hypothetical protein